MLTVNHLFAVLGTSMVNKQGKNPYFRLVAQLGA